LLTLLHGKFQPLYALLDAAREPSVLKVLFESKEVYQSLYEGAQGTQLAHFAPYLVKLPAESALLETLVKKGWGKNWGVYLTSEFPFEKIRQHFRRFLRVKLPDRREVYFRFYDPRVLGIYLPTCGGEEPRSFFGPVKEYLLEDKSPDILLTFNNTGNVVNKSALSL